MDTLNRINFLEPTDKYKDDWSGSSHVKNINEWFNADLIIWALYFHRDGYNELSLNSSYQVFCDNFDISLKQTELVDKFGSYPTGDLDKLITYIIINK